MWCQENKIVNGLYFKQTRVVAPEQYDVFLNEKYVAYVRCRFGKLKVCPVLKDFKVPNVINITDHDYEMLWNKNDMVNGVDYNKPFYLVCYDDPFKYEIPIDEFEKMADAIYKHLEIKEEK